MGKRGPPKKPSSVLKSRKTFRRDRHSDDLEAVANANLPKPPSHLSAAQRKQWHEIGQQLHKVGLCSDLDAICLELLVRSYCEMNNAQNRLSSGDLVLEVGDGGALQANPLVGVIAKHLATLKWCLTQFGMTPSARTGIRLPEPKKMDPMERLLNK